MQNHFHYQFQQHLHEGGRKKPKCTIISNNNKNFSNGETTGEGEGIPVEDQITTELEVRMAHACHYC